MNQKAEPLRQVEQKRRYRYAVGYVIEQEGTKVVQSLVGDGQTRFGVSEDQIPGRSLKNLTRPDAEELLRSREWEFYNYEKIEALTIPTKIFDTHILFSPEVAIENAESALKATGFDVPKNGRLDLQTRKAIEDVRPQAFFPLYIERLEDLVDSKYESRPAVMRRVQRRPFRNVDASDTSL